MTGRIIPETANRQDWPRLVAQGHRDHENRVKALEAVGAEYAKARTITASTTVAADDGLLLADATAAAITVTLPAAASSAGRWLVVKKIDASANLVTLDGNASETIDGATTKALTAQYDSITVHCDGIAWWVA